MVTIINNTGIIISQIMHYITYRMATTVRIEHWFQAKNGRD